MARGGYKFFDTDAHVGPYVDVLDPYTVRIRTRVPGVCPVSGPRRTHARVRRRREPDAKRVERNADNAGTTGGTLCGFPRERRACFLLPTPPTAAVWPQVLCM
jgi:hypothetical protein